MSKNRSPDKTAPLVLVAEDEGGLRRAIADLLHRNGYSVVEARNGEEIVEVARRERPSLILVDGMLPLLDGYAAARVLRRDPATRNIPFLAFQGLAGGNGRRGVRRLRPEDERRLLKKVHDVLALNEKRHAVRA
ncbi:MAG: response regulator [Candidatus Eisenbacteria bacterium]